MARRPLYVRLTDETWAAWDQLATRRNITLTAMIEALGEAIAADPTFIPEPVIDRAREIDRERRSRR
jgi:hypothetical protein